MNRFFRFGLQLVVWVGLLSMKVPIQANDRPNILVILSDDMGFSDVGCYGGEIETPSLDALAANGLRFTQFYNTARCCPTRASLLTGLYPHQAGVGHMLQETGRPGYTGGLNEQCRTIPEVLKPTYRCYSVGKWHVTRFAGEKGPKNNWPLGRGFDRYYGTIHGAGSFYDPSSLVRDNTMISSFADAEYAPEEFYYTDAISDHAVRFIGDHANQSSQSPFFLYVAYTAAHWPMHARSQDIAKYQGKYDAGYESIRRARFEKASRLGLIDPEQGMSPAVGNWDSITDKRWEIACMEVYAAMVDRMDQGIGKIVQELKRTGQFENTLIMYMQDNGGCAEPTGRSPAEDHPNIERPLKPTLPPIPIENFALAGSTPKQTRDGFPVRMGNKVMPGAADTYVAYGKNWAHVSNTPFREYKHWVHEGGISSPLIVHWSKGIQSKGELRKEPSHLIDIAATCVELGGAIYPDEATPLAGRSLLPVFAGRTLERDALFFEHEGNRAVHSKNWKLVAKHEGPWELYDMDQDRVESKDLASTLPDLVKDLARKYEEWARASAVDEWPIDPKKK